MSKCYNSRYGADGPISFPQWAAELFLERQAAIGGRTLAQRFWKDPQHGRNFRLQVLWVNGLLQRFPPEVVSAALHTPAGRKVCTARNPQLVALCEAEEVRLKRQKNMREMSGPDEESPPAVGETGPRPNMSRPGSLFDTLG